MKGGRETFCAPLLQAGGPCRKPGRSLRPVASSLPGPNLRIPPWTGAKDDRPVLAECVKFCLDGKADNLFVSEISRLGRTIKIIVDTIDALTKSKINVFIQDINTNTLLPSGEENPLAGILVVVMGQVATIERKNIANRLHSGREMAKANGVHFGRKQGQMIKTHEDKEREYSKVLRDLRQGLSVAKVAKIHSVSESTVKRLKKEFGI